MVVSGATAMMGAEAAAADYREAMLGVKRFSEFLDDGDAFQAGGEIGPILNDLSSSDFLGGLGVAGFRVALLDAWGGDGGPQGGPTHVPSARRRPPGFPPGF
jgi:hypothetical protein